ncbi:MAG: thermonuclease family protein [Hyphomonadaceae bacterium]|nr:thermonuclease family protein [Hyphomonadaceae bacterium]
MATFRPLRSGFATFAIVFAFAFGVTFLLTNQGPRAEAQTTQLVSSADSSAHIRVIDGDTIEDMRDATTYRLVNIDTPETGSRARCTAERSLGNRATEAARALIAQADNLELRPTGRIDRYGRTIAFVVLDGHDMGETLIAEGFARPWRGRREPWCDANGNLIR